MFKIGCHLSVASGFEKAGQQALAIGANSFQYFTRNPRGGKARALDQEDLKALKKIMEDHDFGPLFAHGSYTMNLCSDKEETRLYALDIFKDDLERLKHLPDSVYVFHPGSHVKQGTDRGIELIIDALNQSIPSDQDKWICLEGMAGKGTEIGKTFEELKAIIDGVHHNHRLGVCLDSCHLHSAGYDLVHNLDGVLDEFDRVVGLDRLRAFHLNDSKVEFASAKDRHERIGHGTIGLDALVNIINHPKLQHLTFNLETPNESRGYQEEIALLRSKKV